MSVIHKQGYSGLKSEMDVTLCGRWGHFISKEGDVSTHFNRENGHCQMTMKSELVTCKRCLRALARVKR